MCYFDRITRYGTLSFHQYVPFCPLLLVFVVSVVKPVEAGTVQAALWSMLHLKLQSAAATTSHHLQCFWYKLKSIIANVKTVTNLFIPIFVLLCLQNTGCVQRRTNRSIVTRLRFSLSSPTSAVGSRLFFWQSPY